MPRLYLLPPKSRFCASIVRFSVLKAKYHRFLQISESIVRTLERSSFPASTVLRKIMRQCREMGSAPRIRGSDSHVGPGGPIQPLSSLLYQWLCHIRMRISDLRSMRMESMRAKRQFPRWMNGRIQLCLYLFFQMDKVPISPKHLRVAIFSAGGTHV